MTTNLITAIITAYCHCSTCCTTAGKPTASGVMPKVGTTIAASRSLPFGTRIHIPSVGWRTVQDRLATHYDNRIDVFMSSHRKAKKFGIKRETLTIILP